MGARMELQDAGIEVPPGLSGNADDAVNDCLEGKLVYDQNAQRHEHDKKHQCGHHKN